MAIRDRQDGFALVVDRLDEPVTLRYRIVEGLGDQAALAEAFAALEDELTPYPPVAAIDIPKAGAPPGIDDGVQKTGDGTFTVKRSLLDAILSNPASVATGARVVPSVKDGKPNGFKLYAIRPTSVFTKLGFQNGDNIHAVAGMEIASADSALAIYTRLRRLKKKSIEIEITRRGKPVILTYRVVD